MICLDSNQLTGIEEANATANSFVVFGERGRLVMKAAREVNYAVYTLSGQLVEQGTLCQGEDRSVNVATGICCRHPGGSCNVNTIHNNWWR